MPRPLEPSELTALIQPHYMLCLCWPALAFLPRVITFLFCLCPLTLNSLLLQHRNSHTTKGTSRFQLNLNNTKYTANRAAGSLSWGVLTASTELVSNYLYHISKEQDKKVYRSHEMFQEQSCNLLFSPLTAAAPTPPF